MGGESIVERDIDTGDRHLTALIQWIRTLVDADVHGADASFTALDEFDVQQLANTLRQDQIFNRGYDIIGRIFEKALPPGERYRLGQHFTHTAVVDCILRFAVRDAADQVLDPSCGAGAFLTRAYARKQALEPERSHGHILATLWGCEISPTAAYLATLNLARFSTTNRDHVPRIVQRDFFDLKPAPSGVSRHVSVSDIWTRPRDVPFPTQFDAIVGNPPYSRQEHIDAIVPETRDYKRTLIERAITHEGENIATLSARAGMHTYFFIHGWKLLANGGRFGFVVLDTWLDADYGVGLQKFLLERFKICAIVGSEIERWFDDADTNTCIVLLERCDAKRERDENTVRFVNLKVKLDAIVTREPSSVETRPSDLLSTIFAHERVPKSDAIRLWTRKQADLYRDGTMIHSGQTPDNARYRGSKWGTYLRTPLVYTQLANRSNMIRLGDIATVRRGFTTGADCWFYVDIVSDHDIDVARIARQYDMSEEDIVVIRSGDGTLWPIERAYVAPVLKNPATHPSILVEATRLCRGVIVVDTPRRKLHGTLIQSYIDHGEQAPYAMGKRRMQIPSLTRTCRNRQQWYTLPRRRAGQLLFQKAIYDCHRHYYSPDEVLVNQRFYYIHPHRLEDVVPLACILNSSLTAIWLETQRAALGLGAIEATVAEVKQLIIPDPRPLNATEQKTIHAALNKLGSRAIGSIFDEYGDPRVMNSAPNEDRLALEHAVLCTIARTDERTVEKLLACLPRLTASRLRKASSTSPARR